MAESRRLEACRATPKFRDKLGLLRAWAFFQPKWPPVTRPLGLGPHGSDRAQRGHAPMVRRDLSFVSAGQRRPQARATMDPIVVGNAANIFGEARPPRTRAPVGSRNTKKNTHSGRKVTSEKIHQDTDADCARPAGGPCPTGETVRPDAPANHHARGSGA